MELHVFVREGLGSGVRLPSDSEDVVPPAAWSLPLGDRAKSLECLARSAQAAPPIRPTTSPPRRSSPLASHQDQTKLRQSPVDVRANGQSRTLGCHSLLNQGSFGPLRLYASGFLSRLRSGDDYKPASRHSPQKKSVKPSYNSRTPLPMHGGAIWSALLAERLFLCDDCGERFKKMCDRLREQGAIPKEEDAGLRNPVTAAVAEKFE